MINVVIKARARYESKTIKGNERFGYCSSVFYDIKILQLGEKFFVKHIEDPTRDNVLEYEHLGELLSKWTIFKVYP
jgi:hypothetical protein